MEMTKQQLIKKLYEEGKISFEESLILAEGQTINIQQPYPQKQFQEQYPYVPYNTVYPSNPNYPTYPFFPVVYTTSNKIQ